MSKTEKLEFLKHETPQEIWVKIKEKLGDILKETNPEFLERKRLLWRGMKAEEVLEFLKGEKTGLQLIPSKKGRPNACTEWSKAVTYIDEESKLPLNMAVGFQPDKNFKITSVEASLPADLPTEAREYQQGNTIVEGEITTDNIDSLIVRLWGGVAGQPEPAQGFIVDKKILKERLEEKINKTLDKQLTN